MTSDYSLARVEAKVDEDGPRPSGKRQAETENRDKSEVLIFCVVILNDHESTANAILTSSWDASYLFFRHFRRRAPIIMNKVST